MKIFNIKIQYNLEISYNNISNVHIYFICDLYNYIKIISI